MNKQQKGNETNSFTSPKIAKPKPRSADRIDKVAVSKTSSQKVVDVPKKAVKATPSKIEAEMAAIDEEADETGTAWVEDADGNFVKKGD